VSRRHDIIRNRIRTLRAERWLSQAELATVLGVSRQTVNAIETGRHVPNLPLAFAVSRFFGVPVEALLLEDEPH
jgi:putative transcriptional regulator